MKCNTCNNSTVTLYKLDDNFYCRNHYPGPDPAEFESRKEHVYYTREKKRPRDNSIDFENEEGNYLGLTEEDSLEAYHQKQADYEKEMEGTYRERQNLLRKLNRSGEIEKLLNPSQYEIFRYIFEFNLSPSKIAKLKQCSHQYIYKLQKEIVERIKGAIY